MLIHVHWEMGWESETQDAQCLKTGKSLDKKLHGALSPPARERPGSTRAIWLKTCAGCTAFFRASKSVLLIPSFLFVLIPWYQIVKSLQKGINVMLEEQS